MSHVEINLNRELLHETGLLWKINHDVLHPLGLSLAMKTADVIPDDVGAVQLSVLIARDGAWQFEAGIDDEMVQLFDDWYWTRVVPEFDSTTTLGGHDNVQI